MDDIAALAEVSKQTVYKNFVDKQRLFFDLITGDIAQFEGLPTVSPNVLVHVFPCQDGVTTIPTAARPAMQ